MDRAAGKLRRDVTTGRAQHGQGDVPGHRPHTMPGERQRRMAAAGRQVEHTLARPRTHPFDQAIQAVACGVRGRGNVSVGVCAELVLDKEFGVAGHRDSSS